jgi:hypothetical protein
MAAVYRKHSAGGEKIVTQCYGHAGCKAAIQISRSLKSPAYNLVVEWILLKPLLLPEFSG